MKILIVLLLFACLAQARRIPQMENKNPGGLLKGKEHNKDLEYIEGDIRITKEEYDQVRTGSMGRKRGSYRGRRWPNPTRIPYKIHSSLINIEAATRGIAAAIKDYQEKTCIQLVPQTIEKRYIEFGKFNDGCSSPVGYVPWARDVSKISLDKGCWNKETVMHEIGHSLGLYHEQSRPDRDQYVKIKYENIEKKMAYNFYIMYGIDPLGTKYDYESLMHYDRDTFSKNDRSTIITKDSYYQFKIGTAKTLSATDIKEIRKMYPSLPAKCSANHGAGPRIGQHKYCGNEMKQKWYFTCGKHKSFSSYFKPVCPKFATGKDGSGSEIGIGLYSVSECISKCRARGANGITMQNTNAYRSLCFCETGMVGMHSGSQWRSCFIAPKEDETTDEVDILTSAIEAEMKNDKKDETTDEVDILTSAIEAEMKNDKKDEETVEGDILTSAAEAKRFLRPHSRKRRGYSWEEVAEECCDYDAEECREGPCGCSDHEVWETCPGN